MTLIAFHTSRHHADIITDTLTYDRNGRSFGHATKVLPLLHLDAVMLSQGLGELGSLWTHQLRAEAADVATFDDLAAATPEYLRDIWEHLSQTLPAGLTGSYLSTVFQVGYSHEHDRMKAYAYPSKRGFQQEDVTAEMVAMPLPISQDVVRPASRKQWVALAQQIRNERALAPIGLKVFVGGDVMHTRLERGALTHRRIFTFDDTGDEFRLMVSGTLHPDGQLGDCACGSGRLQALCHTYPDDSDCTCGRGRAFVDCCKVTPDQILTARAARREAAVQENA